MLTVLIWLWMSVRDGMYNIYVAGQVANLFY